MSTDDEAMCDHYWTKADGCPCFAPDSGEGDR